MRKFFKSTLVKTRNFSKTNCLLNSQKQTPEHSELPDALKPHEIPKGNSHWFTVPLIQERAVGIEREELLDPHYFDELLPGLVDLSLGIGLHIGNPILVPSMGEKERVVGCYGDCNTGKSDLDAGGDLTYWVMKEDTFAVCGHCGLYFFCASPKTMKELHLDSQGKALSTQPKFQKYVKEKLQETEAKKGTKTPISDEDLERSQILLGEMKESNRYTETELNDALEYLKTLKSQGGIPFDYEGSKHFYQEKLDQFNRVKFK